MEIILHTIFISALFLQTFGGSKEDCAKILKCSDKEVKICARNKEGATREFKNECELYIVNCKDNSYYKKTSNKDCTKKKLRKSDTKKCHCKHENVNQCDCFDKYTTQSYLTTTKKPQVPRNRPPFPWPYPWPFPWPVNYGLPWPNIQPSDSLEIGTENEIWNIKIAFPWPRQWPLKYPGSWNGSAFPWPWKTSDGNGGSKNIQGAFNNDAGSNNKKFPDSKLTQTGDIKQYYQDPWWPHVIPKSFMEFCGNEINAFCSDVLLSVMRECHCEEIKVKNT